MRVARTVSGIVLVVAAVLAWLAAGALWVLAGHEGPDGGFDASVATVSTPGYALVVPDVDALLRAYAPVARWDGTTLRIEALTPDGPAFVGLAPLSAVRTYLGTAPYARLDAVRPALGPLPATVTQVGPADGGTAGTVGVTPAAQTFWTARSTGGVLSWHPGEHRDSDLAGGGLSGEALALVVMRPDGAASVQVTMHVAVMPGWLVPAQATLVAAGAVLALAGIAVLLWPHRRRDLVYVVEPAQIPEITRRLTLPTRRGTHRPAGVRAWVTVPADPDDPAAHADVPGPRAPVATPPPEAAPEADAGGAMDGAETSAAAEGGSPDAADAASAPDTAVSAEAAPAVPGEVGEKPAFAPVFTDPRTRPTSLRTAMLLHPTPTNVRGVYRTAGTPPPVTPFFQWIPDPDLDDLPPDGDAGARAPLAPVLTDAPPDPQPADAPPDPDPYGPAPAEAPSSPDPVILRPGPDPAWD